jgi:hypothetical protein
MVRIFLIGVFDAAEEDDTLFHPVLVRSNRFRNFVFCVARYHIEDAWIEMILTDYPSQSGC